MDFQDSKTKENLARSFAAECQEGARYQFMAKAALTEQQKYVSDLIRTIAHNEMAHAEQFFNKIVQYGGQNVDNIQINAGYPFKNGSLVDTLKFESENEKMSGERIYPEFAKVANDEGFKDVAELFNQIAEVELSHKKLLEQLYTNLKQNKLYKCSDGCNCFKCDECGNVVFNKSAPKTCPLCGQCQGSYRINVDIFQ